MQVRPERKRLLQCDKRRRVERLQPKQRVIGTKKPLLLTDLIHQAVKCQYPIAEQPRCLPIRVHVRDLVRPSGPLDLVDSAKLVVRGDDPRQIGKLLGVGQYADIVGEVGRQKAPKRPRLLTRRNASASGRVRSTGSASASGW